MEESEITRLEQQLSVAEETGDRSEECKALGNLGIYLYQLGQFREAVGYCQKYLSVAREIHNSWGEAVAQWYLGYSYKALEMQPEAIEALSQAYRLFRKMGNQENFEQAWTTLNQLGDSYLAEKQYGKAQELYQNQREILQEFNDQKVLGCVLQNLGKAQYYQGNYQSAIESHTLMLEIALSVEDQGMESWALMWLGYDFWGDGQLNSALEYLKKRLALTKTLNDTNAQWETLGWLVNICKNLNDDDGVMRCFYMTEQIELFRQLGDKDSECSTLYELGRWHFNLKQYPESIKSLLYVITLAEHKYIEKANAHYMLGLCYQNLEQTEAIEHYQTAIELYIEQNSNKEWAAKALEYLSAIYRGLKDYEKAIEQQQKRLKLVAELGDRPNEQDALYDLGCIHDDIMQYPQALEYFSSALILANDLDQKEYSANAHYMLGLTYEKLGQIDQAIDHTNQAEKLYTEIENQKWIENSRIRLQNLENKKIESDPQTWKIRGAQLFESGAYQEAISCYHKLLQPELEPNYLLALQALGERQLSSGHYNVALASFKQVVELNSSSIVGWVCQGLALIALQRNKEAVSALLFALELDRNNSDAWCYLSEALFNLQQYQEALKASSRAVEVNSNSYKAWNVRGSILANGFQIYVEALDAFNRVLSINPHHEEALKNRFIILSQLGFSQEEIDKNDSILNVVNLNSSQNWKQLGILRRNQGRNPEALVAYEQALTLGSNDYQALIEKGNILWDLGRLQEGFSAYKKAIEINPNNAEAYLVLGNALVGTESNNELALTCFNEALRLTSQTSWQAWVGRGKALLNLKNYAEALQNYNNAWEWLSFNSKDYQESCGAIIYHKGLVYLAEAQKQRNCRDYWQQSQNCFETALKHFTGSNLCEWYLRVLQYLIPVYREMGETREAQNRLYEGINLLDKLVQEAPFQPQKEQLSRELTRLKQWHIDELAEYKTLFMELLDGVDEGWEQKQVWEHLGENFDNPYLIQWVNSFGRQELEKEWGTPDFDRGYLMVKLGEIDCGQLGEVAIKFGMQIIKNTVKKAENQIDKASQRYQEGNYKEAKNEYCSSDNKWSFDYRIVQSCRQECQEKLEHLEEGLVSRYADTPNQSDDYLAWFNLGEELRKLEYDEAKQLLLPFIALCV